MLAHARRMRWRGCGIATHRVSGGPVSCGDPLTGCRASAAAALCPLAWPRGFRLSCTCSTPGSRRACRPSPTVSRPCWRRRAAARASRSSWPQRLGLVLAGPRPRNESAVRGRATHWLRTVKAHSSSCMQHVAMLAGCCCSSCGAGAWMVGHPPGWQLMIMQDCLAARASCGQALPSGQVWSGSAGCAGSWRQYSWCGCPAQSASVSHGRPIPLTGSPPDAAAGGGCEQSSPVKPPPHRHSV